MKDEAVSTREVMQIAAKAAGGEEKLAAVLGLDEREVKAWVHGTRLPTFGTCINALSIFGQHLEPSPQEQRGALQGAAGLQAHSGFALCSRPANAAANTPLTPRTDSCSPARRPCRGKL